MTQKTNSTFSHLKCSKCNIKYSKTDIYNLSPCCTLPLFPQYDLEKAKSILHKRDLKSRESNMWRYREIMPVEFKEKARQMSFLKYRGFESTQIQAAIMPHGEK